MRVRDIFKFIAIVVGFVIAVGAYGVDGSAADVIEKWGSWAWQFIGEERWIRTLYK
jgi:hypothetical protein